MRIEFEKDLNLSEFYVLMFLKKLMFILLIVFDHVFVLFVIWIRKLTIIKDQWHQKHQKHHNKHSNFLFLWIVSIWNLKKNFFFLIIILFSAATLSPVPEADDYESSELSLSDVVIRSSTTANNHSTKRQQQQPLIKSERKHDLSSYSQQHVN